MNSHWCNLIGYVHDLKSSWNYLCFETSSVSM